MSRQKPITVGSTIITPGSRENVSLPIADLYTATSLHMPVHVINGRQSGPTLFVSAAIHGDELNGVEIIRRLLALKVMRSLRGCLLAVPIVNVHGFLNQSRYLPDRRDLNRSFPGSAKGSIASRLANTFSQEIVKQADFGIDLHTGAIDRSNFPQIRAFTDSAETLKIAKAFRAPIIVDAGRRDGSLRAYAADNNIPIIVYEAGEALRFDEVSIRGGVRGIVRVLRTIGMLPGKALPDEQPPVIANSTSWVRAPSSGIVAHKMKLGERVSKGQHLAVMTDPIGDRTEPVVSPSTGIIIGRSNLPLAHEGEALFNLAKFKSVARAEGVVEQFSNTLDPALQPSIENQKPDT